MKWYKERNVNIYSKHRLIFVIMFEIINFGIIIIGNVIEFDEISSFFLMTFFVNMMLYFGYYLSMKIIRKEPMEPIGYCFAFLILVFMLPGGYLFSTKEKTTVTTPAESRNMNKECIFVIFSRHDLWHFLSSAGLFFTFLFLLVIDDGIADWPQEKIYIF